MTTEEAVKIGDLIIDEETGEILEMPEGAGEPLEWLTHRANEARAASKAWEGIGGMYKKAIGQLLIKAGVKSMRTQYGTPGWRGRLTRTGRPERLPEVAKEHELSRDQQNAILGCASALDAKKLDALEGVPKEAKAGLVDESESSWVQISPATPQPPEVERVLRP
jgi:hypothetical protein